MVTANRSSPSFGASDLHQHGDIFRHESQRPHYILAQRADGSRVSAPPDIGVQYRHHAVAEFHALCRAFRTEQDVGLRVDGPSFPFVVTGSLTPAVARSIGERLVSADLLRIVDVESDTLEWRRSHYFHLGVANLTQNGGESSSKASGAELELRLRGARDECRAMLASQSLGHLKEIKKPASRCQLSPALALLMANLACCAPFDVVYDPFCGAGSLLRSCASGFFAALPLGSDIEAPTSEGAVVGGGKTFFDRVVADIFANGGVVRWCDAIVTDPPFGLREGAWRLVRGTKNQCYIGDHTPDELFHKTVSHVRPLLRVAGACLREGGRLVYLFPVFARQKDLWQMLLEAEKPSKAGGGPREANVEIGGGAAAVPSRLASCLQDRLPIAAGFRYVSLTHSMCRSRTMARVIVAMQRSETTNYAEL
eukprot:g14423.t1